MKPTLGTRLKAARVAADLTQNEVAGQYGLDKGTIWRWETGRSSPTLKQVELLAKLYRVRPAWLTYGDGEMAAARAS